MPHVQSHVPGSDKLPHHRHVKPLGHDPTKIFIRFLISRTKYNIIDIYLAHKDIMFNFVSEESRIGFAYLKVFPYEKILKAFIPCSRSLLKPIERHMELVDLVRIFWIFKPRWLVNIDQFGNWSN
jgi:hypothetical protein